MCQVVFINLLGCRQLRVLDSGWHSLSSLNILRFLVLQDFFFALLFLTKLLSIHWTHLLWSCKRCMVNAPSCPISNTLLGKIRLFISLWLQVLHLHDECSSLLHHKEFFHLSGHSPHTIR